MEYNNVGIMLHRACNASCEICCVESNPSCKEKLILEKVKQYIISTKEVEQLVSIGLTGGEALLEYDKVVELVELIRDCGKKATVMTNCFWAKTYEVAYEKLYRLKQAGLSNLGISFDYYHNQFISEDNIKNALRAARNLSLVTAINTMKVPQWPLGEVIDRLGEDSIGITFLSFPCYPVGAAKKAIPDKAFHRAVPSTHCYCRSGGSYSIMYDGTMYPCCSPYVFDTGLSLGNYETSTAPMTFSKLKTSRVLYLLYKYGFDYFVDIAKNELGIEVPDFVISSCELCALFFSKENIYRFYPYVYNTTEKLIKEAKRDRLLTV